MCKRVLLVDDHEIVRLGLVALVQGSPGFRVVGEASDGLEAIAKVKQTLPDVVVLDVSMPRMNGIEAMRQIHKDFPEIKIVILSMYDKLQYVLSLLRLNISGYVLKGRAVLELIPAMHTALKGELFLSPKITHNLVQQWKHQNPLIIAGSGLTELTSRERQVLQLVSEGKTSKEMAQILKLSENTIVTHRQNVMRKLDLRSIAELTKYAIQNGLTSLHA